MKTSFSYTNREKLMIYLDNAATTKVREEVKKEMINCMENYYANADSTHDMGLDIARLINNRKKIFNDLLGLNKDDIYFTAGGGEGNNLLIQSVVKANKKAKIITTKIEHPSVYETIKNLNDYEVYYVKVDSYGFVDIDDLVKNVDENTVLVSIATVNSELGTIQDIEKIVKLVKEKNKKTLVHTDFVQALGHVFIDFSNIDIDLITFSSHKIYGPKGIGAVYIKKNTKLKQHSFGSNTQNSFTKRTMPNELVLGFLKAMEMLNKKEIEKIQELKDYTISSLQKFSCCRINSPANSSCCILNVSFKNAKGEIILNYLSSKGIYVSTGSACSSKKEYSDVISNIGLSREYANGVIRVSFGIYNTKEEIDKLILEISNVLNMLGIK